MSRVAVTVLGLMLAPFLVLSFQQSSAANDAPEVALQQLHAPIDKKAVQEQLRDFAEVLKRLHHSSGELHSEVSRRETIATGPDIVDDQLLTWGADSAGLYPSAVTSGFQNTRQGQLLPPRKRYIDLSMGQLKHLVPLLDSDLTTISAALSNADDDTIKAQMLLINDAHKRIDTLNQKLASLTNAAPYDNKQIADATVDLRDEVGAIDEARRRMIKLIDRI